MQAFPSAFPGSGAAGGLPGLANAGFGEGLPGVIGTAGTICLFVPVCGEVEIGTAGTVIIVSGVIAAGGAIIHEGVKDGIIPIPNIHLAKGGESNNPLPTWVRDRPRPGESADDFARRVCRAQYPPDGAGCFKGAGSEFNRIRKWARRWIKNH